MLCHHISVNLRQLFNHSRSKFCQIQNEESEVEVYNSNDGPGTNSLGIIWTFILCLILSPHLNY